MAEFFAYAKINVWLNIFAPDTTGYHPLDTLFCAIDLADRVTITPGSELRFDVSGADVGPPEHNLAYRAAREFFATCGLPPRVAIHLHKNIPAGTGLGGGSADAATVLRALNELHDDALPASDLMALAARLGSDVPFFLCGSTLAHATGRGELLRALAPLPAQPLIIAVPTVRVATADAYRWLDEAGAFSRAGQARPDPASWRDAAQHARNDFEPVIFAKHPLLGELKRALLHSGARIALLSGSGSALFALYDDENVRDAAKPAIEREFSNVELHATATLG